MAPTQQHLEEISLNAWPALQTVLYDGWVMRLAKGYTRRANSVTAVYPGHLPLAEKIDRVERLYKQQQLAPVFRLTDESQPAGLDAALTQRGYKQEAPTSVQYLDLSWSGAMGSERTYILPGRSGLESWLGSFHELNPQRADWETHQQLLKLVAGKLCPMVLMVDNAVVACGLGVLTDTYFGVFDVVVDAARRQQGYGTELVESLLDWGISSHAHHAYLQVMVENVIAHKLYAKLGFKELYQYWYRVGRRN